MIQADGSIKTDDLAFATVLVVHGYHPVLKRSGRGVEWLINKDESDVDTHDLVDDYESGAVRVEPRRFARELAAVRKDMYRFLGQADRPRGKQLSR